MSESINPVQGTLPVDSEMKTGVAKIARLQWIDMAKGLGILFMILGHMHVGQPIRDFIYSFHMIMFVMISGYLYKENVKMSVIIPRKIKSLVVPYLLANAAAYFVRLAMLFKAGLFTGSGALGILRAQVLTTLGGSSFYAKHFITIETCGPIWFVTFLFCIDILYALLNRIQFKKKPIQDAVYLIFLIFFAWGGREYALHNGFLPWNLDVVPIGMVFFHCGVMVKHYQIVERIRKYFIWIVLAAIWLVGYTKTGSIVFATREYMGFPISIVTSVCGSLVVMLFMHELEKVKLAGKLNSFLAWIGRSSMIVLAIHTIEFVHIEWIEHLQERLANVWISFVIYAIVVLLCTFVFVKAKDFFFAFLNQNREKTN